MKLSFFIFLIVVSLVDARKSRFRNKLKHVLSHDAEQEDLLSHDIKETDLEAQAAESGLASKDAQIHSIEAEVAQDLFKTFVGLDCNPGEVPNDAGDACEACPAGKFSSASTVPCTNCAKDLVSTEGATSCSPKCPDGYVNYPPMTPKCEVKEEESGDAGPKLNANGSVKRKAGDGFGESLSEVGDLEATEEKGSDGGDSESWDGSSKLMPVRAIDYLGMGYNLLQGNPLGDDVSSADPGFNQPLVDLSFTKADKEQHVSGDRRLLTPVDGFSYPLNSCTRGSKATIVNEEKGYQQQLNEQISVGGGLSSNVLTFTGKTSKGATDFHNSVYLENKSRQITLSYCVYYRAGLTLSDAIPHVPRAGFKAFMNSLSLATCKPDPGAITQTLTQLQSEDTAAGYGTAVEILTQRASKLEEEKAKAACYPEWYNFFNEFGTHVITAIDLGGKMITTVTTNKNSQSTEQESVLDKSKSISGKITAPLSKIPHPVAQIIGDVSVGANYGKDTGFHSDQANSNGNQNNRIKTQYVGGVPPSDGTSDASFKEWAKSVQNFPMPVKYEISGFDIVFNNKLEKNIDSETYNLMLAYYLALNGRAPNEINSAQVLSTVDGGNQLTALETVDLSLDDISEADISEISSGVPMVTVIPDHFNLLTQTIFTPGVLLTTQALDGANLFLDLTPTGDLQIRYQSATSPFLEQIIFSSKSSVKGSDREGNGLGLGAKLKLDCSETQIQNEDSQCNPWYLRFAFNDLCIVKFGVPGSIWCTQTQELERVSLGASSAIKSSDIHLGGSFYGWRSADKWSCEQVQEVLLSPDGELVLFGNSLNGNERKWLWRSGSSYVESNPSTATSTATSAVGNPSSFSKAALALLPKSTTLVRKPAIALSNAGANNCRADLNKNYFAKSKRSPAKATPFNLKLACNQPGYYGYSGVCECDSGYFGPLETAKLSHVSSTNTLVGCTQVNCATTSTPGYVQGDAPDLCKCGVNYYGSVTFNMLATTQAEALTGCWTVSTGYVVDTTGEFAIPVCDVDYSGTAILSSKMELSGCEKCPVGKTTTGVSGNGNTCA